MASRTSTQIPSNSSSQSISTTTTSDPSRTNIHRQQSYTHSFPLQHTSCPPTYPQPAGLSTETKALAKHLLHPQEPQDKTQLFSSGLKWLLDSATETEKAFMHPRRVSLLTETAVKRHNKTEDGKRSHVVHEVDSDGEDEAASQFDLGLTGARRIDDWVEQYAVPGAASG